MKPNAPYHGYSTGISLRSGERPHGHWSILPILVLLALVAATVAVAAALNLDPRGLLTAMLQTGPH
jgi:hypothetical protein